VQRLKILPLSLSLSLGMPVVRSQNASPAEVLTTALCLACFYGMVLSVAGTDFEGRCGQISDLALATGLYMLVMSAFIICGLSDLRANTNDNVGVTVFTLLFVSSFLALNAVLLYEVYAGAPQTCQGARKISLIAVAGCILSTYLAPMAFVVLTGPVAEVCQHRFHSSSTPEI
jgi:hypothetical protein